MSIAVELEALKRQRETGALSPQAFEEAKNHLLEACIRRIEIVHEQKFSPSVAAPTAVSESAVSESVAPQRAATPPASARWGLPPVRVVRGVAKNVSLSERRNGEQYVASIDIQDIYGQPVEISSSKLILIAPGDRVTLGGYERHGRLCALAYYNESNGTHSDLTELREGYRFLLRAGRAIVCVAFALIIGPALLSLLHKHLGATRPGLPFVPYALTALGAAAVSYFGVGLSFLGSVAKDFHDAMSAVCETSD
jgi:hypothetical protein